MDDEVKETFEAMRTEALTRMQMLRLNKDIIYSFVFDQQLKCSENNKVTDVPNKIIKEIEEWQNKFGNLVYHVIHSDYICETYECLSVSCYKEDWEFERNLINDGWVMSHSINITIPEYTESGSIGIQNNNGILKRKM